jgi:hypothetical protein
MIPIVSISENPKEWSDNLQVKIGEIVKKDQTIFVNISGSNATTPVNGGTADWKYVGEERGVTLQKVSNAGGLDNSSTIREGSKDNGFGGGISQVCSNDKELQFEDGVQYYFVLNQPIVHANSLNNINPDSTYDDTKGWAVGSKYKNLVTGKTLICTDATTGNAIWKYFPYRTLQFTLNQDGTNAPTFEQIFVDDFGDVISGWTIESPGVGLPGEYKINAAADYFPVGKTFMNVSSIVGDRDVQLNRRNNSVINIYTLAAGVPANDVLDTTIRLEIIIYP